MTVLLPALRGLHLAAVLSMLGTAGFLTWILPAAGDGGIMLPGLVRWCRLSGWLALVIGAAWFVAQSAEISDASSFDQALAAVPVVAVHTRYGHAMLARAVLLLVAALLAGPSHRRLYPAMLMTALALGLQGEIGHAGASGSHILLASEWLHLLAAGLWLGALMPLWMAVGRLPLLSAATVCERFSPIGLACVLFLAGSGLVQASALIGSVPALFDTQYGQMALLKIILFLLALILAAVNRLWLTDRLARLSSAARRHLRLSVLTEAMIGLLVILAAGFLASTPPGIDSQAVWLLSAIQPDLARSSVYRMLEQPAANTQH